MNMGQRVAARFLSELGVAEPLLTPQQLADELEPRFGTLVRITIHPPDDDPTAARWDALTKSGEVITGTIVLGSRWLNRVMIVYPEILVAGQKRTATVAPRQLLENRLHEIGVALKRIVTKARTRPGLPAHTLAEELQSVVELADI